MKSFIEKLREQCNAYKRRFDEETDEVKLKRRNRGTESFDLLARIDENIRRKYEEKEKNLGPRYGTIATFASIVSEPYKCAKIESTNANNFIGETVTPHIMDIEKGGMKRSLNSSEEEIKRKKVSEKKLVQKKIKLRGKSAALKKAHTSKEQHYINLKVKIERVDINTVGKATKRITPEKRKTSTEISCDDTNLFGLQKKNTKNRKIIKKNIDIMPEKVGILDPINIFSSEEIPTLNQNESIQLENVRIIDRIEKPITAILKNGKPTNKVMYNGQEYNVNELFASPKKYPDVFKYYCSIVNEQNVLPSKLKSAKKISKRPIIQEYIKEADKIIKKLRCRIARDMKKVEDGVMYRDSYYPFHDKKLNMDGDEIESATYNPVENIIDRIYRTNMDKFWEKLKKKKTQKKYRVRRET
ncbi:hypothetical protein TCON_0539 [Astathelohania contejeani]|uniref:Uncharacterized protein n=1 Tax=Astathelohania contejeani TaxID=164912 RepID=A0ABQ7I1H0_9MICR|nr:hypothetical protein TCON_0539 [Thelohania contejeani]